MLVSRRYVDIDYLITRFFCHAAAAFFFFFAVICRRFDVMTAPF